MLKAILIDDEQDALDVLEMDIKKYCGEDVKVIEKCSSPVEGLKAIRRLKPNLVFLDIQMPEINGFEMLEILKDIDFNLVFTTAHDDYAVRAFKVSAVDYLLKPVDKNELITAIEKVKSRAQTVPQKEFQVLLENVKQIKTIAVKNQKEYRFFEVTEIMYVKADGNFSYLYFENKTKEHTSYSLGKMEELLPPQMFFRIHASYIINRNFLKKYTTRDGGYLIMKDGNKLSVAKSRKTEFDDWLGFNDD
ncbi:MAG: LytTR family DNA-binding domain-containing protein [Saprospiraceae bacterium]